MNTFNFSLVETCKTLLKRDLRSNLFNLFAGWTGKFGQALGLPVGEEKPSEELQLSALQAMSALLCCGPVFSPQVLAEDGSLYPWLDMLMASKDEKVSTAKTIHNEDRNQTPEKDQDKLWAAAHNSGLGFYKY